MIRTRTIDPTVMTPRTILLVLFVIAFAAAGTLAQQGVDGKPLVPSRDDDRPKTIQETLEKMRIEKDKKDHEQMVSRGEEVLKLTEQLERSYADHGKLSGDDYSKIASVEKLVKKIRDELGADGDTDEDKETQSKLKLNSTDGGMKSLKEMTSAMFEELKKTTRFSISLSAIQTTNSVLRIVRFLKGGN